MLCESPMFLVLCLDKACAIFRAMQEISPVVCFVMEYKACLVQYRYSTGGHGNLMQV